MPETTLDDVDAASSPANPSTPHSVEGTETDTAVSRTPPDSQPPETAVTDAKDSDDVDPPKDVNSQSAIEFLTGKKSVEKPTKVAEGTPPQPEKKPVEKAAEAKPPAAEPNKTDQALTEEEKKYFGRKAQKRITDLWVEHKKEAEARQTAEAKVKEYEPVVKEGQVWKNLIDTYKVRDDLKDIDNDASVAEAIKFQAALNRFANGRASNQDQQFLSSVFDTIDATRKQFGFAQPQQAVDLTEIEGAIKKARDEFDFDTLEKAVAKLKQPQTQTRQAPPQIQQPVQRDEPTAPAEPSPEVSYFGNRLQQELIESGLTADKIESYVGEKLWPNVVQLLSKSYPGKNPVEVYNKLSPQAQFDVSIRAHQVIRKQEEATKVKPAETPTQPRPIRTVRTQQITAQEPPSGSGLAAARYLAGM